MKISASRPRKVGEFRQTGDTTAPGSQPDLRQLFAEREEFYRGVLESLAEGVLITDRDSRILYANAMTEQITGYSRQELIGAVSYELLTPKESWPTMRRRLKDRLAGGTENYENEHVRRDGTRHWIAVRAVPYRNSRGEIIGTIGTLSCLARQKSLEREREYLLDEIREGFGDIVVSGPALRKVLEQIEVVAPTEASVLILGESGTGKELVARAIHERSGRRQRPLVRVNCAAVPKELFESEFFGHVRGAFTGAIKDRIGRFELADGGTLFLDEVGEIPVELQSKLLRVLQEGQFEKLGEDRTRTVNVRVIAATNRDLSGEIDSGRFRRDLYYRLSVFPLEVPPLRERPEDIAALATRFLGQSARRLGLPVPTLTGAHLDELRSYDWPGNVRELQNVLERAVIRARGGPLVLDLNIGGMTRPAAGRSQSSPATVSGLVPASLRDLKKQESAMIAAALEQAHGKIYGPDGAAALLGLKPTTLASKIARLGLSR